MQQDRQRHSQQTSDVPLFEQPAVNSKKLNLERLLSLVMSANSTICAPCNQDNRISPTTATGDP